MMPPPRNAPGGRCHRLYRAGAQANVIPSSPPFLEHLSHGGGCIKINPCCDAAPAKAGVDVGAVSPHAEIEGC